MHTESDERRATTFTRIARQLPIDRRLVPGEMRRGQVLEDELATVLGRILNPRRRSDAACLGIEQVLALEFGHVYVEVLR